MSRRECERQSHAIRTAIVEAGAIDPLVALVRSGAADGQKWAALALVRLADDDDIRTSIVEAGAIDPLVALLRSDAAKEDYRQTGPHYGWRSSWAAEVVSLVNMATGPSWLDYPFLSPDLRIYL